MHLLLPLRRNEGVHREPLHRITQVEFKADGFAVSLVQRLRSASNYDTGQIHIGFRFVKSRGLVWLLFIWMCNISLVEFSHQWLLPETWLSVPKGLLRTGSTQLCCRAGVHRPRAIAQDPGYRTWLPDYSCSSGLYQYPMCPLECYI